MELSKKKIVWIILIAMMIFGFYLRSFHLDFPSIGYHNMKENEYLSQAYNQYEDGDYLRRRMHIFGREVNEYFEEYPQMPLIPWMFVLMWTITGVKFWSARLIIVLFSILTIPAMYYLTKKLTKSDYIALLSSFLFSFMPLAVFFGRNIQPEAPALFFLICAMYQYISYLDDPNKTRAIKFGACLAAAALFKYTFLIGLLPMAAIFPYNKLKQKEWRTPFLKHSGWVALTLTPIPLWTFLSGFLNTKETLTEGTFGRIDLFRFLGGDYWNQFYPTIKAYALDNWTQYFMWFALLGLAFAALRYRSRLAKFLGAYALAIVPYGMILADFIKAHNYYQYPFIPLICIASAYFIFSLGSILKSIVKVPYIQYLPLLLLLFTISDVQAHTNAQYDTLFYGLDVVGDYLKEHSTEDERLWIAGHAQSFGVCYNSLRWCGPPWWTDLNKTLQTQEEKNFRWLFIHGQQGLAMELRAPEICGRYDPNNTNAPSPCPKEEMKERQEIWDYFTNNYRIRLIGTFGNQPEVYLLEKGGNFSLQDLNSVQWQQRTHTYTRKNGDVQMTILEDNS